VESCKLRYFNSFEFFDHTRDVKQWNVSFVPLIDRLTTEGGASYFLVPGNHAGTTTDVGMKNYLDAVGTLIPEESSPRRLKGHTTFSFGYGNTFVIGLDANIAGDEAQYNWTKAQLEGLDRKRYLNVVVFCHQAPTSEAPLTPKASQSLTVIGEDLCYRAPAIQNQWTDCNAGWTQENRTRFRAGNCAASRLKTGTATNPAILAQKSHPSWSSDVEVTRLNILL
jgi:hypothetical protein